MDTSYIIVPKQVNKNCQIIFDLFCHACNFLKNNGWEMEVFPSLRPSVCCSWWPPADGKPSRVRHWGISGRRGPQHGPFAEKISDVDQTWGVQKHVLIFLILKDGHTSISVFFFSHFNHASCQMSCGERWMMYTQIESHKHEQGIIAKIRISNLGGWS